MQVACQLSITKKTWSQWYIPINAYPFSTTNPSPIFCRHDILFSVSIYDSSVHSTLNNIQGTYILCMIWSDSWSFSAVSAQFTLLSFNNLSDKHTILAEHRLHTHTVMLLCRILKSLCDWTTAYSDAADCSFTSDIVTALLSSAFNTMHLSNIQQCNQRWPGAFEVILLSIQLYCLHEHHIWSNGTNWCS